MNQFALNIEARKRARDVIEMIGEEVPRFWECLVEEAKAKLPTKEEVASRNPPMPDEEALIFETLVLTFGKYSGVSIENVDPEYLLWLVEHTDPFVVKLKRYLQSNRFKEHYAKVT